ncbi:MAG TPA: alpha/beta fold hydrolase [Casimicrobiaceae bacterium]
MTPHEFTLAAADGYPLAARLWTRGEGAQPLAVALVNAGAGISSAYYDRFAHFLAARDVPTLVYDYRGIGRSRPRSLRGFAASVEDWGSKDCAAALEWLGARFPGARRLVVGHSVGGFVTGFVTNGPMIDLLLLVGAHTGYWRDYAPRARVGMYLLWHVTMPILARLVGYFPGRRIHLLEDLPAGVAIEWANRRRADFWWNLRTEDGQPDSARIEELVGRFLGIHARTLALRFTDDAFATEASTDRMLGLFRNCNATRLVIGPPDVGGQKIGHFGFFRSRFRGTLWPRVVEWLRAEEDAESAT